MKGSHKSSIVIHSDLSFNRNMFCRVLGEMRITGESLQQQNGIKGMWWTSWGFVFGVLHDADVVRHVCQGLFVFDSSRKEWLDSNSSMTTP